MARAIRSLSTAQWWLGLRFPLPATLSDRRAARRRRRSILPSWLIAAILAVSVCASATAQQYKSDTPDASAKANSGVASLCVRNPAEYATNKERFANYFNEYYFPAMTLYKPEDLEVLGALRFDLFRNYLWKSQSEDVQRDLTNLAFQAMARIVTDNAPYHPTVRYNAVLVLGMLDEQYAIDAGANRRPPKPLPAANKALTQVVDMATTSDRFPPAVTVGALVGLERHAQYHESLSAEATEAMATAALKIIDRDEPIQDVDKDVHAWMQLQAANVLANLGKVGQGGQNLDGLMKLIAGDGPLDDRCQVARLLSKISFQDATVDGKAVADSLMKLALEVTQDEAKRATRFQEQSLRESRSSQPETYERRLMLSRLVALSSGLQAVGSVAPDATKAHLANIASAINEVTAAAGSSDTIDLVLTDGVLKMAGIVQAEVSAAAAAPPGDAPKTSS
jgi:hypothetical protein